MYTLFFSLTERCVHRFTGFYGTKHSGRKLNWLYHMCRGELVTNCFKNKYTLQDKKSLTVQSPRDTRIIPPSPKDLLSSLKITDMKQKSQLNTGSESFTNQRISFQIKKLQIEDLHHQLMQKPRESVTVAIN